ncbi:hypothetical protein GCM10010916_09680 [Paenibacillus abyssi]|uniref:Uncharacterized protein n=1 Tax=Paenibacillus abyssi TaxID=1340531 RepID=A0A917CQF9_9BACL|nr:hypothetical protein GCM10010916_09680 [Paenibacillus abyssi]
MGVFLFGAVRVFHFGTFLPRTIPKWNNCDMIELEYRVNDGGVHIVVSGAYQSDKCNGAILEALS